MGGGGGEGALRRWPPYPPSSHPKKRALLARSAATSAAARCAGTVPTSLPSSSTGRWVGGAGARPEPGPSIPAAASSAQTARTVAPVSSELAVTI